MPNAKRSKPGEARSQGPLLPSPRRRRQSGPALPSTRSLLRQIIEVMHMDTNHEVVIAKYSAMLKAKTSHIAALSAGQRAVLRQQWSELVDEVKAALDEDPAGP
jgi:hypothetical protein